MRAEKLGARTVAPLETSKTRTESMEGSTGPLIDVPYGWQSWASHIDENGELMGVAATPPNMISPHVLRPAPMALHSNVLSMYQSPPHRRMTVGEVMDEGEGEDEEGDCPLPNQVKFVNSTVEILQNQIKRDEAPKKKRTRTTPDQLRILQKAFTTDPMPNSSARLTLAKKLGMNARAVQVWFQNRRAKEKLEAKRAETGTMGGIPRERSSLPGNLQCSKSINPFATSSMAPTAPNTLRIRRDNMEEDNHAAYDLGMYFCDPSLAQYATGFDLGAYSLMDSLSPQQVQLFDDFEANPGGSEATSTTESGELDSNAIHTSSYSRFQSMPMCSYGGFGVQAQDGAAISGTGENSLGILFDANAMQERHCTSPSKAFQRSNSIDVLGIMGDAAASMEAKIFSTPAAREAFITAPLGQSIPIPAKQRSQSVPDLGNSISHFRSNPLPSIGTEIPPLFRSGELLAIKEEELPMTGISGQNDASIGNKHGSNTCLAPSSLLETFPGIVGVGMDDIQAYLDGMSTSL